MPRFQFHNEAHLKPPISDLKSIIIEKSKIDPDSKLIISALKLQHLINTERRKILTDTDEIAMSPFFKQKLPSKLINSDHYIFLTLNDQLLFCISLMHKRDAKAPIFLKNFLG